MNNTVTIWRLWTLTENGWKLILHGRQWQCVHAAAHRQDIVTEIDSVERRVG